MLGQVDLLGVGIHQDRAEALGAQAQRQASVHPTEDLGLLGQTQVIDSQAQQLGVDLRRLREACDAPADVASGP